MLYSHQHKKLPLNYRQKGSVLTIALFILLVLTIIGATALNDTVMEERMSSNFQNGNIAFQATESGINNAFITIAQERELVVQAADVAGDQPKTLKDGEEWPSLSQDLEVVNGDQANIQTTSNTDIVYVEPIKTAISPQGANLEVNDSDTFAADIVELVTTGGVNGTNISRTHIQGVQRLRPGSGQAD